MNKIKRSITWGHKTPAFNRDLTFIWDPAFNRIFMVCKVRWRWKCPYCQLSTGRIINCMQEDGSAVAHMITENLVTVLKWKHILHQQNLTSNEISSQLPGWPSTRPLLFGTSANFSSNGLSESSWQLLYPMLRNTYKSTSQKHLLTSFSKITFAFHLTSQTFWNYPKLGRLNYWE